MATTRWHDEAMIGRDQQREILKEEAKADNK